MRYKKNRKYHPLVIVLAVIPFERKGTSAVIQYQVLLRTAVQYLVNSDK